MITLMTGATDAIGSALACVAGRNAWSALLVIAAFTACRREVVRERPRRAAVADTLRFPAPERPVSRIVAPRWTGEDERDHFDEAARVIALAGVRPGMTVADVGAGDGYYVTRLSPVVGARGRVLGEDIMPDYLDLLRRRVAHDGLRNVDVVLGTADDPRLPARALDAALLIHMYHEITRPFDLLWHLSEAMKPGATIAILDQDAPTDRHGTPPQLLTCELAALGFAAANRTTLGDGAYVALFTAPAAPLSPATVRARLSTTPCTGVR